MKASTVLLSVVLLLLGFHARASPLSCLDQDGLPVDRWQALKAPSSYNYYENTVPPTTWVKSPDALNQDTSGSIMRTVRQVFPADPSTISAVLFNDEPPPGGNSVSTKYAHAKGILVVDDTQGFWVTHSMPSWPASPSGSAGPGIFPSTTYGQTIACITVSATTANAIAAALRISNVFVYYSQAASSSPPPPDLRDLIARTASTAGQKYSITPITTLNGLPYTVFSKAPSNTVDIYDDIVAPFYQTALRVETWRNGAGGRIGSVGRGGRAAGQQAVAESGGKFTQQYNVFEVQGVVMPDGVSWRGTQDHSKWAAAVRDDTAAYAPNSGARYATCIGDLNRMCSQEGRGGGALCQTDQQVWNAFNMTIQTVAPLEDTATSCAGNVRSQGSCYWCKAGYTPQPSTLPTRQPSPQPSSSPTNPTGQPSRQPTSQPTSRPTVMPTTTTRTKEVLQVSQTLYSITKTDFVNNLLAQGLFKLALVASITHLTTDNIAFDFSKSTLAAATVEMGRRSLATDSLNLVYTLTYVKEYIMAVNGQSPLVQLNEAIATNGNNPSNFTTTLQKLATASQVTILKSVTSASTITPKILVSTTYVVKTVVPSSMPTSLPEPTARPTVLSDRATIGIAVGVTIAGLLLALSCFLLSYTTAFRRIKESALDKRSSENVDKGKNGKKSFHMREFDLEMADLYAVPDVAFMDNPGLGNLNRPASKGRGQLQRLGGSHRPSVAQVPPQEAELNDHIAWELEMPPQEAGYDDPVPWELQQDDEAERVWEKKYSQKQQLPYWRRRADGVIVWERPKDYLPRNRGQSSRVQASPMRRDSSFSSRVSMESRPRPSKAAGAMRASGPRASGAVASRMSDLSTRPSTDWERKFSKQYQVPYWRHYATGQVSWEESPPVPLGRRSASTLSRSQDRQRSLSKV